MQKMQLKRIGVLSFAKTYAVVTAGIMLIIGVPLFLLMTLFGAAMATQSRGGLGGFGFGLIGSLFFLVFMVVVYAIVGFIIGALMAVIYNVAAGFAGGVEMELEGMAPEYGAPPPPQWNQYQQPGGGYQQGQQPPY